MNEVLYTINMWSEVWSLLIPLTIIFLFKPKGKLTRPVIIYTYVAFFLNLVATILYVFHSQMPPLFENNNIYYNLHSFFRVLFFIWYIYLLRKQESGLLYKTLGILFILLVIINFTFFESPLFISSRLFAGEGLILLFFCITYLISSSQDESNVNWLKQPSFLIWTGVGLYETITIFIFLFFYQLSMNDTSFGELTMTIRKMTYLIFCILLAIALYIESQKRKEEKSNQVLSSIT